MDRILVGGRAKGCRKDHSVGEVTLDGIAQLFYLRGFALSALGPSVHVQASKISK
jgi:hypothetical protein